MADAIANPPNLTRKYQHFMGKFNPTLPAPAELRVDLRPDLARRMAARAILEKGCQQVIFGGVGSGKTTELLAVKEAIETEGQKCLFLDMSLHTNLDSIKAGAILAAVGEGLRQLIRNHVPAKRGAKFAQAIQKAKEFAHGKFVWVEHFRDNGDEVYVDPGDDDGEGLEDPDDGPESYQMYLPGKLEPTRPILPNLQQDVAETRAWLPILLTSLFPNGLMIVIDGLDRLHHLDSFWTLVDQDLRILRELEVSVVIVAPLLAYFTPGRDLEDRFDKTHALWSLPKESPSLLEVLKRRDRDTLPPASATEIGRYSGGVLRDLVSLARDAGEEAYLRGSEQIEQPHVDYAVQQLGLSYRRGLGPIKLEELQKIYAGGGFDIRNVQHRELLATRRLIEYSPQEFAIHPALLNELFTHDWPH